MPFRGVLNIWVIVTVTLFGCKESSSKLRSSGSLDYLRKNASYWEADSLTLTGDFEASIRVHRSRLLGNVTSEQYHYSLNEIVFCSLQLGDTSVFTHYQGELEKKANEEVDEVLNPTYHYNQGKLLLSKGQSSSALPFFLRALNRFNEWDLLKKAITQYELGNLYRFYSKRLDSAEYYLNASKEIVERYEFLVHLSDKVYFSLADLSILNRDYVAGLNFVDLALENLGDQSKSLRASCLVLKAFILAKKGMFNESIALYENALEWLDELSPKPKILTGIYEGLAFMGLATKNEELYRSSVESIKVLEQNGNKYANSHRVLGHYYDRKADYRRTIEHFSRAVDKYLEGNELRMVEVLEAYYILSQSYLALGQFDQAKHYVHLGLTYGTSKFGKRFSWKNILSNEVSSDKLSFINYNELANIYLKSFEKGRSGIDSLKKAVLLYKTIDSLLVKNVRMVEEDAVLNFLRFSHDVYTKAISTHYYFFRHNNSIEHLEKAHYYMERSKSTILRRDVLSNYRELFPQLPDSVRREELTIRSDIAAYKRSQSEESFEDIREMRALLKKQETYYNHIKEKYPGYYKAKYDQNISSFRDIQNQSSAGNEIFVQYHVNKDEIFMLVYHKDEPFLGKITVDSTLKANINQFSRHLKNPPGLNMAERLSDYQKLGGLLFERLLEPSLKHTNGSGIVVVTDGILNEIPFESLVISDQPVTNFKDIDFLIKHYGVRHIPSTSTESNQNREFIYRNIYALSYSDLSTLNHTGQYRELSGAIKEVDTIEEIFGSDGTYRYGKDASKNQFLLDLKDGHDIIHLALHAFSSTSDRFDNKIVFRSDEDFGDELYGYELLSQHVNSNLVVLTACQSASGTWQKGEGTYSLTRWFMEAGAPAIISSQWNQADHASHAIFKRFYENLSTGQKPFNALLESKRVYLENTFEETAHPYYWAGIVYTGVN